MAELWSLADVYGVADSKKSKKKDGGNSEHTAMMGEEHANANGMKKWWEKKWKGKGKYGKDGKGKGGKYGKGKGKGKGKSKGKGGRGGKNDTQNANNAWSSGGKNDRGSWYGQRNEGWWGKGPQQDSGWTDKKQHGIGICHYDAEGKICPFGEKCKFEHKNTSGGGGGTGGAPRQKRNADPKNEPGRKRRRPDVAPSAEDSD